MSSKISNDYKFKCLNVFATVDENCILSPKLACGAMFIEDI